MQQVTIQDYRDAWIHEHLSLTTIKTHRSILQAFVKQQKEFGFNLTTRNVFDYLMFNANVKSTTSTFGEVSDVHYSDIANYIGKKERTIVNEIGKLCRAGLIERHPTKRKVFIIPSIIKARDELVEQAKMKKQMKVTEKCEQRLAELESDGVEITGVIRNAVYADEMHAAYKRNRNGNGNRQGKLPIPFSDSEIA